MVEGWEERTFITSLLIPDLHITYLRLTTWDLMYLLLRKDPLNTADIC